MKRVSGHAAVKPNFLTSKPIVAIAYSKVSARMTHLTNPISQRCLEICRMWVQLIKKAVKRK